MSDKFSVICDGSEYDVARAQVEPGPSPTGTVWVIRSQGFYIGTFDGSNASEDELRTIACEVIRHGSTSSYPVRDRGLPR